MIKDIFTFTTALVLHTIAAFAATETITAIPHALTTSTTYPAPSQQLLQDFEKYVQKAMKEWTIPGMAVGVVQGDKVVYTKGFGVKTLGSLDPVTPETIFQIGSVTKSFTAALTAMLVDEEKCKWNDKVTDYLPEFMLYDPWVTRQFQITDLMSQRSGLPSHAGDSLYLLGYDRAYIKHALRYIEPASSFRSQYSYVNTLFLYVADLIEKFSGKSWEQSITERIFTPLQMSNSSVDKRSFATAKNVASAHVKVNEKIIPLDKDWPYLGWSYTAGPAGSITSNITDMVKWLSFQMNEGKIKDKQLISENNMNVMHAPITPMTHNADGNNLFYGLGWVYKENTPLPIIWHDGEVTGMKSMVAFVPNAKVGIVILSNLATEIPELLAFRFFEQYFDKKLHDYSGELLAQEEEKQRKTPKPTPPSHPSPPLPLEKYAGNFFNNIYGTADISLSEGKLIATMGSEGVFKTTLSPWDRDAFLLHGSPRSKDEDNGFISFEVDPKGNVQHFTIDALNAKFQRVQK